MKHNFLLYFCFSISNAEFDVDWWHTIIVPQYHQAGIAGIAHITGNPNATGRYRNSPDGLQFQMAEFENIESALKWQL